VRQLKLSQWIARAERLQTEVKDAISAPCCVKRLPHDSVRQMNLTQLTHDPLERKPQKRAEMQFWHSAASNDCFTRQLNLTQLTHLSRAANTRKVARSIECNFIGISQ
jgi:hypothetical protein